VVLELEIPQPVRNRQRGSVNLIDGLNEIA